MRHFLAFLLTLVGTVLGVGLGLYLADAAGWFGTGLMGPIGLEASHASDSVSILAGWGLATITCLLLSILLIRGNHRNDGDAT